MNRRPMNERTHLKVSRSVGAEEIATKSPE